MLKGLLDAGSQNRHVALAEVLSLIFAIALHSLHLVRNLLVCLRTDRLLHTRTSEANDHEAQSTVCHILTGGVSLPGYTCSSL
jgi:hypothetical protein